MKWNVSCFTCHYELTGWLVDCICGINDWQLFCVCMHVQDENNDDVWGTSAAISVTVHDVADVKDK